MRATRLTHSVCQRPLSCNTFNLFRKPIDTRMSFTSRPATPSPKVPTSEAEERFEDKGYPVEWAELYRPGGFHPIHIGDSLDGGRYRVIRKLGYGSFSTVWLAVDTLNSAFVALKVAMSNSVDSAASELRISTSLARAAEEGTPNARHVLQLLGSFEERGPNGTHLVLVYPAMAGTVASMVENLPQNREFRKRRTRDRLRYPKWMAKRILKHTLLGLDFLHRHDIVHGDLQPGNLLFSTRPLSEVNEVDLTQDMKTTTMPLTRRDGRTDLWAPRYLALGQQMYEFAQLEEEIDIKISDLGAAFFKNKQPAKIVTPVALRAPETIFKQFVDEKIDIWSFGCLIYELITGTQLFAVCMMGDDTQEDADDDHLLEMHDILGELPADIMALWPRAHEFFGPNGERLNRREKEDDDDEKDVDDEDEGSDAEDDDMEEDEVFINDPLEVLFEKNKPDDINDEEAGVITTLIRRILKYKASERPSAVEILKEKWFEDA